MLRPDAVALKLESWTKAILAPDEVPGVGPIISSAVVAAIGTGAGFKQGRDFGAWLGLVPKQESTGDRTILGKISKRGNKYLRTLFVQAAHVVLVRQPHGARLGLWPWIETAGRRLHRNMLVNALANKLARIARAVLARGGLFGSGIAAEDAVICQMPEIAQARHGRGFVDRRDGVIGVLTRVGVLEVSMS